jgi:hypothetical protein
MNKRNLDIFPIQHPLRNQTEQNSPKTIENLHQMKKKLLVIRNQDIHTLHWSELNKVETL